MKSLRITLTFLALISSATSQEEANDAENKSTLLPATKWEVVIPEPIADRTQPPPAAKPVPIDFNVISSRTMKMDVVRAPEMHDLPPITGRINITVRMVEDPGLPEPTAPLPAFDPEDPVVIGELNELREKYQGTSLIFISASVYDHKRTLLRIHTNPGADGEVTAWSNLDFNHFSGFSTYRVIDGIDGTFHDFGILMGFGNEDTVTLTEMDSRNDMKYEAPVIPRLTDLEAGGPAFVVLDGHDSTSAINILEQIHDLYRVEGGRMEAAFLAREKARAERKAFLLANPPKPEDMTISFWRNAVRPAAASTNSTGEQSR